jgi:hypothetical protein
VLSAPPPAPARRLTFVAHDMQTDRTTFQIEKG